MNYLEHFEWLSSQANEDLDDLVKLLRLFPMPDRIVYMVSNDSVGFKIDSFVLTIRSNVLKHKLEILKRDMLTSSQQLEQTQATQKIQVGGEELEIPSHLIINMPVNGQTLVRFINLLYTNTIEEEDEDYLGN